MTIRLADQYSYHSRPTPKPSPYYNWNGICDQCGIKRSAGSHKTCSRKRQALALAKEAQ